MPTFVVSEAASQDHRVGGRHSEKPPQRRELGAQHVAFAHRRDLFRIERLDVEARSFDDGHAGLHRGRADEFEVRARAFEPGVDDARDAVALRRLELLGHEIDVAHRIGTGRSRRRSRRPLRR